MKSVYFHTFGCRVNQYETEAFREKLLKAGYRLSNDSSEAELCVVNSCSVTAEADRKCRQFVRKILRGNSNARVIVTGCYATRDPAAVRALSPRVEVFSNQEKDTLPEIVAGCSLISGDSPILTVFSGHTRAFVKVQDGCDATCTYCIIPSVRPKMESRSIETIKREVESLVREGYREVVLTGIRLGSYGLSSSGGRVGKVHGNLAQLLSELVSLPGTFRIRLSSLEITEVTDELLELVQNSGKICRNFHLPLQSGDDSVLRRMGRWYDSKFYAERAGRVRECLPDACITADVITGFPGESEEHFENTYLFIEKHLNGLHVFPFSDRPGTSAVKLPGHNGLRAIRARVDRLLALDRSLRHDFHLRFAGQERMVLAEPDGGFTDNGIWIPAPLPFGNGTLERMAVPEPSSAQTIPFQIPEASAPVSRSPAAPLSSVR